MSGYNLTGVDFVSRNADLRLKLAISDEGVPRPLTGWEFEFVIALGRSRLLVASTANGKITVPAPSNGELFIALLKADFVGLSDGIYDYWCVGTLSGATENVLEEAKLEIR